MQTNSKISLVLAISALLMSCSNKNNIKPDTENKIEKREIRLNANIEQRTKTMLSEDDNVVWSSGDKISIFYEGEMSEFSLYSGNGSTSAEFVGFVYVPSNAVNESLMLHGIYPHNPTNSMSDGEIFVALPADQKATAETFATNLSISVGKGNSLNMMFENVCGLLEFTLTRDNIKRVVFKGNNNETLSGVISVGWDGDHPKISNIVNGGTSLTLANADGSNLLKDTKYYFVIPPTVFTQGVTLTFHTSDDERYIKTITGTKSIKRSVISYIPDVDADAVLDMTDYVTFTDKNFENYCLENFDTDKNGYISKEEAAAVISIEYKFPSAEKVISSLNGIEYFVNLESLICEHSPGYILNGTATGLSNLDLSQNTKLRMINVYGNCNLTSINISACTELTYLDCSSPCYLTTNNIDYVGNLYEPTGNLPVLDVTNNIKLRYLDCSGCRLTTLDLTKNTELTNVIAFYNQLHTLKLDQHPKLDSLYLTSNSNLRSLDLKGCPNITWIAAWRIPNLKMDLSNCTNLKTLWCTENESIYAWPENGFQSMKHLSISFVEKGALELSRFPNLTNLDTWNCHSLDLSACPGLEAMGVHNNKLSTLDVSVCPNMHYLCIDLSDDNGKTGTLRSLDISKNANLYTFISKDKTNLNKLFVSVGQEIEGVTVNRSDEVIHPDILVIEKTEGISSEGFIREEF